MALTETRVAPAAQVVAPRPRGLGAVGAGDHKAIGRFFIVTSLLFLLAGTVSGELLSVDRLHGTSKTHLFLTNDRVFTQLFTNHVYAGALLGLIPLFLGIALVVVPLQVGARTVAFPRAAVGSYFAYLFGAALYVASIVMNGGAAGGRAKGIELWILALIVIIGAVLVASVCVATTAIALRAPGMTLDRVPLFTWGMVVSAVIWILTLPVLVGLLAIFYVDLRHGRTYIGDIGAGSIYYRSLWVVRQPQVFVFAAPALGFAGEVFAVAARARYDQKLMQYQGAMINIGLFAILGFGAYTVNVGSDPQRSPVYIVMSFLIVLPVLALFAVAGDLFRRGRKVGKPQALAPLMFAVTALVLIIAGGIAAAIGSVPRAKVAGPTLLYGYGQANLVLLGGIAAGLGALYYWSTKILGRPAPDLPGASAAFLVLAGGVVFGVSDLISGGFGNKTQAALDGGIKIWNYIGAAGGAVALLGGILAVLTLLPALRSRPDDDVPADPWEGHTLEWFTTSPPAFDNFVEVPFVTSEAPLLDRREAAASAAGEGPA